jgi:hypothetical protein
MKRLRHPVRAITEPFGKAGLIVAVLALVLALTGAAFAAAGLNGKQKKEVEKIAKKFAGKPGAAGAQGPAGPAGPAGAAGKDGANGTNGTNGTSVTTSSFGGSKTVGSVTCEEGGVEVKSASPATAVCNGAAAAGGGFAETLPEGKTETGGWSVENATGKGLVVVTPISFPIPLELGLDSSHVVFLEAGEGETTECPGSVGSPEAAAGYLCVYSQILTSGFTPGGFSGEGAVHKLSNGEGGIITLAGADQAGALLMFQPVEEEGEFSNGIGFGTWAVTAP